jgi:hypothetical protein
MIAKHLFEHLRGTDNLAFAGSRQSVEIYADRLRTLCEDARLPQEFYPHHASLSREHREVVERRLKDGSCPPPQSVPQPWSWGSILVTSIALPRLVLLSAWHR